MLYLLSRCCHFKFFMYKFSLNPIFGLSFKRLWWCLCFAWSMVVKLQSCHMWVEHSTQGNMLNSIFVVHWRQAGHFIEHNGHISIMPYRYFSVDPAFTKKTRGSCCLSCRISYWKFSVASRKIQPLKNIFS